jgi:hypothetical protein
MIKTIFCSFIIFICLFSQQSFSQQLPNQSFEEWKTDDSKLFEDPAGGFWGTINRLRLLGPSGPITTEKSTDAHSGLYSAKITTKSFGTFKILGIIATGIFDQKTTTFIEGMPFNSKPSKLTGYYKYQPVNNDSCSAYINLTIYNTILQKKDTIAEGIIKLKGEENQWTKFEIPIKYYLDNNPDTIKVAFVSSAGTIGIGSTQNAQIGSSMLVDDLVLEYETGIETSSRLSSNIRFEYSYLSSVLYFENHSINNASLKIFNTEGKLLCYKELNGSSAYIDFSLQPSGVYFYQICSGTQLISIGSFLK